MRALIRLLRHASWHAGDEDATTDNYVPVICERWLGDRDRVSWTRDQLGRDLPKHETNQRVGQLFCNVIYAWGEDLDVHGVRGPQDQRAAIERANFDEWTVAMEKYGRGEL